MNATLTAYDETKPNYLTFAPDEKTPGFATQLNQVMKNANYQVVATDYTNYALIYSCMSFPFLPSYCITANLWVMSRSIPVTDAQLAAWDAIMRSNNVPTDGLFRTNQDECPN
jgi:hypothetical protein